jgi:hypothetical protein
MNSTNNTLHLSTSGSLLILPTTAVELIINPPAIENRRRKKRKTIQKEYYNRFVSVIDQRMYFTAYYKKETE